jgi:hypothetical protein
LGTKTGRELFDEATAQFTSSCGSPDRGNFEILAMLKITPECCQLLDPADVSDVQSPVQLFFFFFFTTSNPAHNALGVFRDRPSRVE